VLYGTLCHQITAHTVQRCKWYFNNHICILHHGRASSPWTLTPLSHMSIGFWARSLPPAASTRCQFRTRVVLTGEGSKSSSIPIVIFEWISVSLSAFNARCAHQACSQLAQGPRCCKSMHCGVTYFECSTVRYAIISLYYTRCIGASGNPIIVCTHYTMAVHLHLGR
jgi:hypothetical protein